MIEAFAQEDASQERFDEVNLSNRDANITAISLSFVFLPGVEFLGMLATGIVLWFGGIAVGRGDLTLGVVVAFLAYVTRFFQPIQELSQLYTTMQAAMAGGEQVFDLLDEPPKVTDQPGADRNARSSSGESSCGTSRLPIWSDTPVLHSVNLAYRTRNDRRAGGADRRAGKTSIANLIGALLRCHRRRCVNRRHRCSPRNATLVEAADGASSPGPFSLLGHHRR